MALKLSFNPGDGSPVWADAYHRVQEFRFTAHGSLWVLIGTYYDYASKNAGKPPRHFRDYDIPYDKTGTNPHAQAYAYLKASEPEFQGAEDE